MKKLADLLGGHEEKENRGTETCRIDISINKRKSNSISALISVSIKQTMNESPEYKLAYELAETLDDREAIQLYLNFCKQYPEIVLREIAAKVLAIPENKIRKTRGALFNFLVQQHAAKGKYYPRD